MLIVDPPEGWKYGFPRPYTKRPDESEEEWFLRKGYPQKLIDLGMLRHCRFWSPTNAPILKDSDY